MKIALLQHLCDIPAFSKLLHCSNQAALRTCFFCKDVGIYNHFMNKVLHINNREFLPEDSPLRLDKTSFPHKTVVLETRPCSYSHEEETELRNQTTISELNFRKKQALRKFIHSTSCHTSTDSIKCNQMECIQLPMSSVTF